MPSHNYLEIPTTLQINSLLYIENENESVEKDTDSPNFAQRVLHLFTTASISTANQQLLVLVQERTDLRRKGT